MQFANLLKQTFYTPEYDYWEREWLAMPVRAFVVRLHSIGLSYREAAAVLALLGEDYSNQAIFQWDHRIAVDVGDSPTTTALWVALDETAIKINGQWQWLW